MRLGRLKATRLTVDRALYINIPKTYLCYFKVSYPGMSTAMEAPLIHAQRTLQVLLYPALTHLSINHLSCRLTLPRARLLPHPCVSVTHKSTLTAFTACNHWLFVNLRHCSAPVGQEPRCVDLDILNMTSHKARPYHQQPYWREGLRRSP